MHIFKLLIIFLSILTLNSCEHQQVPEQTKRRPEQTLGIFDSSYDKATWSWIDNGDGRNLLKNKMISDCYVGYNTEPLGYEEPGFDMSAGVKIFRDAKYNVFTITQNNHLYCITYSKQNSRPDHNLTVYALHIGGKCQEEAEAIITSYEASIKREK